MKNPTNWCAAMAEEAAAFALEQVSKIYSGDRSSVVALDKIDLRVEPGQFVAICGQSGSGKSTLLALLGGLCRPSSGRVSVGGTDLGQLTRARLADFRGNHVGFVFQFASLLPNLRAIDNIALPALLQDGGNYEQAYHSAGQRLAEVGLADRGNAFPRELSGGQQRRVAIARALVNRPRLLLADEPTSDLDEQTAQEIFALLRQVQRAHGATLILVTHDTSLARAADRLIYLDRGQIVQDFFLEQDSADRPARLEPVGWIPPKHPALQAHNEPTAEPAAPLGAGLGRFALEFTGWTLAVVLLIFVVNWTTARFQKRTILELQGSRRQVEELAFRGLRFNLDDLVEESDGSYCLTLALTNVDEGRPIYVMGPTLRAFVQVDQAWQGVSLTPIDAEAEQVERLDARRSIGYSLRIEQERFDELLKGYQHLRFTSSMLVAESAAPGEDLFERVDEFYIYLRPRHLSEAEVRQRNGWKPDAIVPLWIPMPAH
jgi:macrolide transport system ATP-binding/permease protein